MGVGTDSGSAAASAPWGGGGKRGPGWVVRWTQFVLFLSLLAAATDRHVVAQYMFCPARCSCLERFVDCSRRQLTVIPEDLPAWTQQLNISYNRILEIEQAVWLHTPHLKVLRLSNNSLTSIPKGLSRLQELEELYLNSNFISVPYSPHDISRLYTSVRTDNTSNLSNFTDEVLLSTEVVESSLLPPLLEHLFPHSLVFIDLSANKIVEIDPNWFQHLASLKSLFLQNNEIADLRASPFANLTTLETLNISGNRLTMLPKEIFKQTTMLRKLDLSYNQLARIEGLTFQFLDKLEFLSLRKNRIKHLSDGALYGMNNIQQIHLEFNNILVISKTWLYGLSSLTHLFLQNNSITHIGPDAFEWCKHLLDLNIDNNRIETIHKGSFFHLASIRSISLAFNQIRSIEDSSFKTLASLQTLNLSHNSMQYALEDTGAPFLGLSRLTSLDLANNSIRALPARALMGLSRVTSLNLDNNPLSTINVNSFRPLKRISELRLNTHALLCDCALSWLPAWLRRVNVEETVTAVCGLPLEVKGRDIFSLGDATSWSCGVFAKPTIIESPAASVLALRGQSVALTCRATMNTTVGAELITFHWRKENRTRPATHEQEQPDPSSAPYAPVSNPQNQLAEFSLPLVASSVSPSDPPRPALSHVVEANAKISDVVGPRSISVEAFAEQDATSGFNRTVFVSRLVIRSVDDEDAGRYQCVARNRFGSSFSNRSRLSVHVFPHFTRHPPPRQAAAAGTGVVLECAAGGQPKPVISWQKDGGDDFPAARERRMQLRADEATFYIDQLKPIDTGVYSCTATNTVGFVVANVSLTVIAAVPFARPTVSKKVHEGDTIVVECPWDDGGIGSAGHDVSKESLSGGAPIVTGYRRRWYKDERPLEPTERHFFVHNDELLIITQVDTSDGGRYACDLLPAAVDDRQANHRFQQQPESGHQRQVSLLSVLPKVTRPSRGVTTWLPLLERFNTFGIVVVAVVVCVIITSLIWIVIIVSTQKQQRTLSEGQPESGKVDVSSAQHCSGRNSSGRSYLPTGPAKSVGRSVYGDDGCSTHGDDDDDADSVSMLGPMQPLQPPAAESGTLKASGRRSGVNARLLNDDSSGRTMVSLASGRAYFMKEQSLNGNTDDDKDDEGISSGGSSSASHHTTPAHHHYHGHSNLHQRQHQLQFPSEAPLLVHRVSTFQPEPPAADSSTKPQQQRSTSSLASDDPPHMGICAGSVSDRQYDENEPEATQPNLLPVAPQPSSQSSPKPALPRKPPHLLPQLSRTGAESYLRQQNLPRDPHQQFDSIGGDSFDADDPELIEISRRCQRSLSQRSINDQLRRKSNMAASRLQLDVNSSHMDSPDVVLGGSVTPTATIRRTPACPRSPSPNTMVVPVPPPCIPTPFSYEGGPQDVQESRCSKMASQHSSDDTSVESTGTSRPVSQSRSRPATPRRTSASSGVIEPTEEQRNLKPFTYGNPFGSNKMPRLPRKSTGGDETSTAPENSNNALIKGSNQASVSLVSPASSTHRQSVDPVKIPESDDLEFKAEGGCHSSNRDNQQRAANQPAVKTNDQQGPPKRAPPPPPPPLPPSVTLQPLIPPKQKNKSSQLPSSPVIV